jgi:hypothetical protein
MRVDPRTPPFPAGVSRLPAHIGFDGDILRIGRTEPRLRLPHREGARMSPRERYETKVTVGFLLWILTVSTLARWW